MQWTTAVGGMMGRDRTSKRMTVVQRHIAVIRKAGREQWRSMVAQEVTTAAAAAFSNPGGMTQQSRLGRGRRRRRRMMAGETHTSTTSIGRAMAKRENGKRTAVASTTAAKHTPTASRFSRHSSSRLRSSRRMTVPRRGVPLRGAHRRRRSSSTGINADLTPSPQTIPVPLPLPSPSRPTRRCTTSPAASEAAPRSCSPLITRCSLEAIRTAVAVGTMAMGTGNPRTRVRKRVEH